MASFAKQISEEQEDEFWESSRVKVKKGMFNMFDDNYIHKVCKLYAKPEKRKSCKDKVSVEAADALARSKKILDVGNEDDDLECINWDGTPVSETGVSKTTSQQHEHPSSASSSTQPSASGPDPSYKKPSNPPYMSHTRSQSHTFGVSLGPSTTSVSYSKSQERLPTPRSTSIDNLSLEEVVSKSAPREEKQDPAKMAEQIRFLQRSLEKAKISGISKPSPEETIKRIIYGEPFNLEVYKGKDEKLELLDKAIELHDGNAITATVLFLKKTIKPATFNIELQRRPVAVNHYISYLRAHFDFKELADLLGMLGRIEEAAMLKYKQATFIADPLSKIRNLDSCRRAHFMAEPPLQQESSLIHEQISLLERQRPIEDADNAAEKEGKIPIFKNFPRKASIINMPVITTLYYCCFYHPHLGENSLASPLAIRKQHQLNDKQYLWTALNARSRLKQWAGVEELLTAKGWFGGTKLRAVIGFDKVCEILNLTGAPIDILAKYLRMVENADKRLTLSKKMKCHEVAVDTFVSMKDRGGLEAYTSKLTPHSKEAQYARDALSGSIGKWK